MNSNISLLLEPIGRLKLWFVEFYVELCKTVCVLCVRERDRERRRNRQQGPPKNKGFYSLPRSFIKNGFHQNISLWFI